MIEEIREHEDYYVLEIYHKAKSIGFDTLEIKVEFIELPSVTSIRKKVKIFLVCASIGAYTFLLGIYVICLAQYLIQESPL